MANETLPDWTQPQQDVPDAPASLSQAPENFYQPDQAAPFMPDIPLHHAAVDPNIEASLQAQGQQYMQQQANDAARQDAQAGTQKAQQNRIKAEDLRLRGIPTFQNASGDVAPVTDTTGAPLTQFDAKNGIAYDSQGNAKAIQSNGLFQPPSVSNPFSGVPDFTDPKTGDVYKRVNGLPWEWEGQDPAISGTAKQAAIDKLNKQTAEALGGPISQYHAQYNAARVNAVQTGKQLLQSGALPPMDQNGQPVNPTQMDPDAIKGMIDQNFAAQYAAPEANDKHFFGGLTADAQAIRDQLDARKAAAMSLADTHIGNLQKMQDSQSSFDQLSTQQQTLRADNIDAINKQRVAIGLDPISLPAQAADGNQQQTGNANGGAQANSPAPSVAAPSALNSLPDEQKTALTAAAQGQKAYSFDEQNGVQFQPGQLTKGIRQAVNDGLMDPDKAKEIAQNAADADKAWQDREDLVAKAGGWSRVKALLHGAGEGAAFLATAPAGAGVGAEAGSALGPIGTTVGGIAGGIIAGTAGAMGYKALLGKLGEYNDTIDSFNKSAELHPVYDAAGNLLTFGAGLPSGLMRGAGAAVEGLANQAAAASDVTGETASAVRATLAGEKAAAEAGQKLTNPETADTFSHASTYLDAVANAYKGSGGGLKAGIENLTEQAATQIKGGATRAAAAATIARDALTSAGTMVAIDTAVKEGGKAFGHGDGQTWGGVAQSAIIGAMMTGHGLNFPEYNSEQLGDIVTRGTAHDFTRTAHTDPLSQSDMEAIAAHAGTDVRNIPASIGNPLTPEETEVYNAFKKAVADGTIPTDPKGLDITAKQVLQAGRAKGIVAISAEKQASGGDVTSGGDNVPQNGGGLPSGGAPTEKPVTGKEIVTQGGAKAQNQENAPKTEDVPQSTITHQEPAPEPAAEKPATGGNIDKLRALGYEDDQINKMSRPEMERRVNAQIPAKASSVPDPVDQTPRAEQTPLSNDDRIAFRNAYPGTDPDSMSPDAARRLAYPLDEIKGKAPAPIEHSSTAPASETEPTNSRGGTAADTKGAAESSSGETQAKPAEVSAKVPKSQTAVAEPVEDVISRLWKESPERTKHDQIVKQAEKLEASGKPANAAKAEEMRVAAAEFKRAFEAPIITAHHKRQEAEANPSAVDQAAHDAATSTQNELPEPTEAQKTGAQPNYKMGHPEIGPLKISIENPAGSQRRPEWPTMTAHYGYLKGSVGFDKDHVDVYIKPGTPENYDGPVFVVNQNKGNGHFDETKAVLGVSSEKEARDLYAENHSLGEKPIRNVVRFDSVAAFNSWAKSDSPKKGEAREPAAQKTARGKGVIYQGQSMGLHAFKDPNTGGNFSVSNPVTGAAIKQKLDAMRAEFKKGGDSNGIKDQRTTTGVSGGTNRPETQIGSGGAVEGKPGSADNAGNPAGDAESISSQNGGGTGGNTELSDVHGGKPAGQRGGNGESGSGETEPAAEKSSSEGDETPGRSDVAKAGERPGAVARSGIERQLDEALLRNKAILDKSQVVLKEGDKYKTGFAVELETGILHINTPALAKYKKTIEKAGGNFDKWMDSVLDEEATHNMQANEIRNGGLKGYFPKLPDESVQSYFVRLYGSLSKDQKAAIKALYTPPKSIEKDMHPMVYGAEYTRAADQVERNIPLPQEQYKQKQAKAFVAFIKAHKPAQPEPAVEKEPATAQEYTAPARGPPIGKPDTIKLLNSLADGLAAEEPTLNSVIAARIAKGDDPEEVARDYKLPVERVEQIYDNHRPMRPQMLALSAEEPKEKNENAGEKTNDGSGLRSSEDTQQEAVGRYESRRARAVEQITRTYLHGQSTNATSEIAHKIFDAVYERHYAAFRKSGHTLLEHKGVLGVGMAVRSPGYLMFDPNRISTCLNIISDLGNNPVDYLDGMMLHEAAHAADASIIGWDNIPDKYRELAAKMPKSMLDAYTGYRGETPSDLMAGEHIALLVEKRITGRIHWDLAGYPEEEMQAVHAALDAEQPKEIESHVQDVINFIKSANANRLAAESPAEQKGFPSKKIETAIKLAHLMIRDKIDTPEMMAKFVDQIPDGKLRPYAQALWDIVGSVQPKLRGTHDWQNLFKPEKSEPSAPESAPAEAAPAVTAKADEIVAKAEKVETKAKPAAVEPKVLKVQKEFLLSALDKAIEDAPESITYPAGDGWMTPKLRHYHALTGSQPPMLKEEDMAQFEKRLKIWNQEKTEKLPGLLEQYNIPEKLEAGSSALSLEGAPTAGKWPEKIYTDPERIEMLRRAISEANTALIPKISIEIPGDGTFKLLHYKAALENFLELAKKKFPTTLVKPINIGGSNARVTPTNITPIGKPKGPGDLIRIAGNAVTTDATRFVLQYVHSDGKNIVATNGSRLIALDAKAGGSKDKPVVFDPKTAATHKSEGTYPNWQQVVPVDVEPFTKKASTGELEKLIIQASGMTNEKSNSVNLWLNPDGTFGMMSQTPEVGSYQGNMQKGAQFIGAYSPEFLKDGISIARKLGYDTVSMAATNELSPMLISGSAKGLTPFKYVIMPMRVSGDTPAEINKRTKRSVWSGSDTIVPEDKPTWRVDAENAFDHLKALKRQLMASADSKKIDEIKAEGEQLYAQWKNREGIPKHVSWVDDYFYNALKKRADGKFVPTDQDSNVEMNEDGTRGKQEPAKPEKTVKEIWQEQYNRQLKRGDGHAPADAAMTGFMLEKTPQEVYDDLIANKVMPHNALYAVKGARKEWKDFEPEHKEIWQTPYDQLPSMPSMETGNRGTVGMSRSGHADAIEKAFREGKTIPESVKRDYPKLFERLEPAKPDSRTPDQIYEAARAAMTAEGDKMRAASKAYHAKEIGDTEFLAAKDAYKKAQGVMDKAETDYIEAKNSEVEQPKPTEKQAIKETEKGVALYAEQPENRLRALNLIASKRTLRPDEQAEFNDLTQQEEGDKNERSRITETKDKTDEIYAAANRATEDSGIASRGFRDVARAVEDSRKHLFDASGEITAGTAKDAAIAAWDTYRNPSIIKGFGITERSGIGGIGIAADLRSQSIILDSEQLSENLRRAKDIGIDPVEAMHSTLMHEAIHAVDMAIHGIVNLVSAHSRITKLLPPEILDAYKGYDGATHASVISAEHVALLVQHRLTGKTQWDYLGLPQEDISELKNALSSKQIPQVESRVSEIINAISGIPESQESVVASFEETPKFKQWSGDLPIRDISQKVPRSGVVIRASHGTSSEFTDLNTDHTSENPTSNGLIWVGDSETAKSYGNKTRDVYIRMKKPYILDYFDQAWGGKPEPGDDRLKYDEETLSQVLGACNSDGEYNPNWIKELQAKGYDGIIVRNIDDRSPNVIKDNPQPLTIAAAFDSGQIKSKEATTNNSDDDIFGGRSVDDADQKRPRSLNLIASKRALRPDEQAELDELTQQKEGDNYGNDRTSEKETRMVGRDTPENSPSDSRGNQGEGGSDDRSISEAECSRKVTSNWNSRAKEAERIAGVKLDLVSDEEAVNAGFPGLGMSPDGRLMFNAKSFAATINDHKIAAIDHHDYINESIDEEILHRADALTEAEYKPPFAEQEEAWHNASGIVQAEIKRVYGRKPDDDFGAEYLRMLGQVRSGRFITERSHKDVSLLVNELANPQSPAVEAKVKAMLKLLGWDQQALAAEEPEQTPDAERAAMEGLGEKEHSVMSDFEKGKSLKEIGSRLGITEDQVKSIIKNVGKATNEARDAAAKEIAEAIKAQVPTHDTASKAMKIRDIINSLSEQGDKAQAVAKGFTSGFGSGKDAHAFIEQQRKILADKLSDLAKDSLPPDERGRFMKAVLNAIGKPTTLRPDSSYQAKLMYARAARVAGLIFSRQQELYKTGLADKIEKVVDLAKDNPSIDADYRDAIRDKVANLDFVKPTKKTLRRLEGLKAFIDSKENEFKDVDMPDDVLARLDRLSKIHVGDLPNLVLETMLRDLITLDKLGRLKLSSQNQVKGIMARISADDIAGSVTHPWNERGIMQAQPTEKLGPLQILQNYANTLKNKGKNLLNGLSPIAAVLDSLGESKGDYDDALFRQIKGPFDNAHQQENGIIDKHVSPVLDALDAAKITKAQEDKIGLWLLMQQDGVEYRLQQSGVNQTVLNSAKSLTPEEMKIALLMRSEIDKPFPQLQRVAKFNYNLSVQKVDKYWPLMRDHSKMPYEGPPIVDPTTGKEIPQNETGSLNQLYNDYDPARRTATEKGFTVSRVKNAQTPVIVNAKEVFIRHMAQISHFIAFQSAVNHLVRVMKDPRMEVKLGTRGKRMILDLADTVARNGHVGAQHKIAWLDQLRKNLATYGIAFRVTSQFKHLSNIPFGMYHAGGANWFLRGAAAFRSDGAEQWIRENASEILHRAGGEPGIEELNQRSNAVKWGFYMARQVDLNNAASTFLGRYLKQRADAGFSPDNWMTDPVDRNMVNIALNRMARAVPSVVAMNQPQAISRGSGLGDNVSVAKTIFAFSQFLLDQFSNLSHDFYRAGIRRAFGGDAGGMPPLPPDWNEENADDFSQDPEKLTPQERAKAASRAATVFLVVAAAILSETAIVEAWKKLMAKSFGEDQKKEDDFAKQLVIDAIRRVPFANNAIQMGLYGRTGIPSVDALVDPVKNTFGAVTGKHPETRLRSTERAAQGVAGLFGVPGAGQVGDLIYKALPKYTPEHQKLVEAVRNGNPSAVSQAVARGTIKPDQVARIYREAAMSQKQIDAKKLAAKQKKLRAPVFTGFP